MNDQLIRIEDVELTEIFQKKGGVQPLLDAIEEQVKNLVIDISTKQGQKEMASMARRIASSKTLIDSKGKELKKTYTVFTEIIDSERAHAKKFLTDLKDQFRKPLTDMEDREKERLQKHKNAVDSLLLFNSNLDSAGLESEESRLKEFFYGYDWEEFTQPATCNLEKSVDTIAGLIVIRKAAEAEKAELERLQKEEAERKQKEREEQIRKDVEAKAEREKQEIRDKAERDRKAAVEKAEQVARQKAQAEEAKSADFEHQKKVNHAVYDFFLSHGISADISKKLLTDIIRSKSQYLRIKY